MNKIILGNISSQTISIWQETALSKHFIPWQRTRLWSWTRTGRRSWWRFSRWTLWRFTLRRFAAQNKFINRLTMN